MPEQINLSKGGVINLSKKKPGITEFCAGVNWGKSKVIVAPAKTEVKKVGGFFGFGGTKTEVEVPAEYRLDAVDLDLSCAVYDKTGKELDRVYYNRSNLTAPGIRHSGDDLTGDDSDDSIDNETIQIDLSKVRGTATEIVFVLNSFNQGQDFHSTAFSRVRLYTGKESKRPSDIVSEFRVDSDVSYKNKRSLVLGKLIKINGEWEFRAIGEVTNDTRLSGTLSTVKEKFLGE